MPTKRDFILGKNFINISFIKNLIDDSNDLRRLTGSETPLDPYNTVDNTWIEEWLQHAGNRKLGIWNRELQAMME